MMLINKFYDNKKEKYEGEKETSLITTSSLILFAIMFYAGYLSWNCNTKLNLHVVEKVIYATFSALFGFVYLIFYVVFNRGRC